MIFRTSLGTTNDHVAFADGLRVVRVKQRAEDQATVIALFGDLDREAAGQLRDAAARAADSQRHVVIEMSGVTQMPAPVMGALVGACHRLEGRVTVNCSAPVFAALEETGLDRLLPVA